MPLKGLRIIPLVISKQRVIQFNSSCDIFLMKLVPKQASHMWELYRTENSPSCMLESHYTNYFLIYT